MGLKNGWIPDYGQQESNPKNFEEMWNSKDAELWGDRLWNIYDLCYFVEESLNRLRQMKKDGIIPIEDYEDFLIKIKKDYWPNDSKRPLEAEK